jgi:hypothetical protein
VHRGGGKGGVGVDNEKQAVFVRVWVRANEAANDLHTQAEGIYEVARQLEDLRSARDRAVSERLGALMPFLLAQDEQI